MTLREEIRETLEKRHVVTYANQPHERYLESWEVSSIMTTLEPVIAKADNVLTAFKALKAEERRVYGNITVSYGGQCGDEQTELRHALEHLLARDPHEGETT